MTVPDAARPRGPRPAVDLAALTDPGGADPGWHSAEQVAAWLLRADEPDRLAGAEHLRDQGADEQRFLYRRALGLARLGTAGSADEALAAVSHFGAPGDPATVARVLVARSLPWLADFAQRWIEAAPFDARPTVDELVELGAVVRPNGDRYASAMTAGLPDPCPAARIRARLLTRPTRAGADVRAMLTAPGAGARLHRLDGASRRRLDANTWTVQIADLVEEELLDRAMLIELCLSVLTDVRTDGPSPAATDGPTDAATDAPTEVATERPETEDDDPDRPSDTWFAGLYRRLEPTAADLEPHVAWLRRLLAAPNPRLVELAQHGLLVLARAGKLTGRDVLHHSTGPLARTERRLALGQLRLLAEVIASGPGIAPAAVRVVAQVLDHPRPDVQIEALRFVMRHADPAAHAALDLSTRSPALRAAAEALRTPPATRPRPGSADRCAARVAALPVAARRRFGLDLALAAVQAGRFPHVAPAPSGPGAVLPAVGEDPAEVAALLALGMESDADPVLIQQALAAAVRSAQHPVEARAAAWGPYRDAAAAVRAAVPFQHRRQPRRLLAELAECWARGAELPERWLDPTASATRTVLTDLRAPQRLGDVLAGQIVECTRLLARQPGRPLLAEPTHASGAVDPDVLLERLARLADAGRAGTDAPLDVELAALRLPRGLPLAFWAEAVRRAPDLARALQARYAAQAEPPLRAGVGVPAHRLGFRLGEGPRRAALASARPGHRAPGIWWVLTDLDEVFALRPHRLGADGVGVDAVVPHWPTVAPWHPELVAAHLLTPLAMAQQPGGIAAPGAAAAVNAPTGGLLGPIGHLALVQGLQGVRGATRLAAAGTWRAVVLDGRLDPGPAVAAMLLLHGGGLLRPARIVGALRTVVADPVVGYCTLQVLTAAAGPLFAERAPQLHLLLGLAEELAARFGADPALDEVWRAADPRKRTGRHRTGLPATGPERGPAALAALDHALNRFEAAG